MMQSRSFAVKILLKYAQVFTQLRETSFKKTDIM